MLNGVNRLPKYIARSSETRCRVDFDRGDLPELVATDKFELAAITVEGSVDVGKSSWREIMRSVAKSASKIGAGDLFRANGLFNFGVRVDVLLADGQKKDASVSFFSFGDTGSLHLNAWTAPSGASDVLLALVGAAAQAGLPLKAEGREIRCTGKGEVAIWPTQVALSLGEINETNATQLFSILDNKVVVGVKKAEWSSSIVFPEVAREHGLELYRRLKSLKMPADSYHTEFSLRLLDIRGVEFMRPFLVGNEKRYHPVGDFSLGRLKPTVFIEVGTTDFNLGIQSSRLFSEEETRIVEKALQMKLIKG